ncbi:MAG: ECF transporter S component [Eggerthellaceae bacterium]|nr:ECF transporter S component [Eggerthellaceae bacterium]
MTKGTMANIWQKLEIPALIIVPMSLLSAAFMQVDQSALLTMVVVLLSVLVFFASFEASRPQLRQIMPTVVLAALAVAGRIVFAVIPNVQPVGAITIMAGIIFGRRSGFMVGALAMLLSNFFLGQGPWTPWQMYGFGLMGYLAGVLADHGAFERKPILYGYGLLAPILEYGFLLNSWYIIGYVHPITWQSALLAYGAGLPLDLANGISTVIFLLVLYAPWRKKLERIKHKYDLAPDEPRN